MKTILFSLLILTQINCFAQSKQPKNYKERASSFMLIGNLSLGASLLCLGGAAATKVPRYDPSKSNDSYYISQYNNEFNTYIQTRNELLVIGGISGAMAITSYTITALCLRKDSKLNRMSGVLTPKGFYMCYRF